MKVTGIEVLRADAGWRNYYFLKLTTDAGIIGWSEFDEGFGSPGISAVIDRLTPKVVGQDAMDNERIFFELYSATRPAAGGVVAEGLGAIENALLDAKAKALGVPCYTLLGGKCATGCGSTGRIARHGGSTIRTCSSRRSLTSTGSRRSAPRSASVASPR